MVHLSGVHCLSASSLAELADELQRCVYEYSEELVQELAHRDELDFEKELKNQFIWLLLRVQRRRRQLVQLESRAAVSGLHTTPASNSEVRHNHSSTVIDKRKTEIMSSIYNGKKLWN